MPKPFSIRSLALISHMMTGTRSTRTNASASGMEIGSSCQLGVWMIPRQDRWAMWVTWPSGGSLPMLAAC